MKNKFQNFSTFTELEESSNYEGLEDLNESKINFSDILSLIIFIISICFLLQLIIF